MSDLLLVEVIDEATGVMVVRSLLDGHLAVLSLEDADDAIGLEGEVVHVPDCACDPPSQHLPP
jgi:hypothetical protein